MTNLAESRPTVRSIPSTRRSGVRVPRTVGFIAISAALLAMFMAAGAPTPLLPLYEQDWGFSHSLLTVAFGVYAFALIASLLVAGSLSDHIGRRPVLIGALGLELVAMVVFLLAPSIEWLIVARILQGIATGVASSTFGAAIVELAPESRKKLGAVMSSLATTAGLGLGALFSGLVALAIPASAAVTVWKALIVVMAVGTVFAILTPETAARRPGAVSSLVPRVGVPLEIRRLFAATVPSLIAGFLVTGLFLGLVPTILAAVFGVSLPIVGALVVFTMFGVATVSSAVTSGIAPHHLKFFGDLSLALGMASFLAALATRDVALIWASAVVSGAGMGAAFSGSIRSLIPAVKMHERAQTFSAIFTVSYLVFGGAVIAAGFIAASLGVSLIAVGFVLISIVIALLGAVVTGLVARDTRVS